MATTGNHFPATTSDAVDTRQQPTEPHEAAGIQHSGSLSNAHHPRVGRLRQFISSVSVGKLSLVPVAGIHPTENPSFPSCPITFRLIQFRTEVFPQLVGIVGLPHPPANEVGVFSMRSIPFGTDVLLLAVGVLLPYCRIHLDDDRRTPADFPPVERPEMHVCLLQIPAHVPQPRKRPACAMVATSPPFSKKSNTKLASLGSVSRNQFGTPNRYSPSSISIMRLTC